MHKASIISLFTLLMFISNSKANTHDHLGHAEEIHWISAGKFDDVILKAESELAEDPTKYSLYQNLTKSYAYVRLVDIAIERTKALYFSSGAEYPSLIVSGYCRLALFETMKGNRATAMQAIEQMLLHSDPEKIYPGAETCATYFDTHWGNYARAEKNLTAILAEMTDLEQLEFLPWLAYVKRALGKQQEFSMLMAQLTQTRQLILSGAMDDAIRSALEGSTDDEITQRIQGWLAQVYALEGDYDASLESLKASYEANSLFRYHWWKTINPIYETMRHKDEFKKLIRHMEQDIAPMRQRVMSELDIQPIQP